ncbi:MAG: hypothetical protein U9Q99_03375 [Nanoarchaeota archaeon]|nr:hypothetical protein [Nanoarchaeota archaeon]
MINRKGNMLPEETLKIVLGVIVIGFLIYLLASIYFASSGDKKLEQAKGLVERIEDISSRLNLLENGFENITEVTPFGWHIFSFTEGESKPNQCSGENCLCVCDKVNVDNFIGIIKNKQIQKCGEKGACVIIENLKDFEEIKINTNVNPTTILISKNNNLIEVNEI